MWLFCKCRRRRMTLTRLTPYRAVFPTGYHKPLHKKRQKLCWKRRENSEFSNKCLKYIKYIIKRDLNKSACCMTGVKLNLTLVIIGWFMTSLQWLNINVAVRSSNGQFPLWDAPAGDRVNSVRHLGLGKELPRSLAGASHGGNGPTLPALPLMINFINFSLPYHLTLNL